MNNMEAVEYDVIHLVRVFHPNIGGMENLVHEVARRQAALGQRVLVVTSDIMRDGKKATAITSRVYDVLRIKSFLWRGIFLPSSLRTQIPSCDTLHCHGMDPFVDFLSLKIKRQRFFISPHGGFFHTGSLRIAKNIYYRLVSRFLASQSAQYMCISQNDMALVSKLSDQVFFMGCGSRGVDYSLPGEGMISFGRISKNKCINDAVDVFLNNFNTGMFTIAGPNPEGLPVDESTRVQYVGSISDEEMDILIQKSKYFISMSSYEGLGMALIEAIKGGLIPVVRRIGAYEHIDRLIREKTGGVSSIIFVDGICSDLDLEGAELPSDQLRLCSKVANELWSWGSVVKALG